MISLGKILLTGVVGAGLIKLLTYASALKRTSAELQSIVTANIHSLKLDGLTIRIDVQLKNPTSTSLKIKYPFLKVLFNDSVVGTSKAIDQDISIPANGEAKISGIMVNMPATNLLSLGSGLLNVLLKKQPAQIKIGTISTIDLGWQKLPYTATQNIELKPQIK